MGSPSDQSRSISTRLGSLEIQGFVKENSQVANYLGIQYASIPARFRQSQPVDHLNQTGTLDATRYGPRCPQNFRPKDLPLYEGVQKVDVPDDEFGCLRLNVFGPIAPQSKPLPVLVWIHGGGFVFGDGGWEFDGNSLVQHAVDIGQPIVYVSLNYRLGYYGFLTSKELKDEAAKDGQKPYANMAFYDQRLALLWVRDCIRQQKLLHANINMAGAKAHIFIRR